VVDDCCKERKAIQQKLGKDVSVVQDEFHLLRRPVRALKGKNRKYTRVLNGEVRKVLRRDDTGHFPNSNTLQQRFAAMISVLKNQYKELYAITDVQKALINFGLHLSCVQVLSLFCCCGCSVVGYTWLELKSVLFVLQNPRYVWI